MLVSLLEKAENAGTIAQGALDKSKEANDKYDACVAATTAANIAAADANAVREEVEAGGYIRSLQEENKGKKFSVWVGTEEEYDAIPEASIIPNCLYLTGDDQNPFATTIEDTNYPGCFYRMVGDEKEWFNPPMEAGAEYRTMERLDGEPVYVLCDDVVATTSVIDVPISVKELVSFSGYGFYKNENLCNDIIPFYLSDSNYVGFMVEGQRPSISLSDSYVNEDGDYVIKFTIKYTKQKAGE